jgi:hypothetical protein
MQSTVSRSLAVAIKSTSQLIQDSYSTIITGWSEETDTNNDFDPVSGLFTARRDGNYSVSFSFNFIRATIAAGTQVEAMIQSASGVVKKSVVTYPAAGTAEAGASISFVLKLGAGDKIAAVIWHNTGSDKTLRTAAAGTGSDGFVNFSVAEL